jgi:hypothetical protein
MLEQRFFFTQGAGLLSQRIVEHRTLSRASLE